MATWYFDSVSGSDANGGHAENDAKQNYNPNITAAGDTILFKRGTIQRVTASGNNWVQNGSSNTARARYGAYGTATVPYAFWNYGGIAHMVVNAAKSHWIDFEDLYFDMSENVYDNYCVDSLYFGAQTTNATYENSIRRCFFKGSHNPTGFTGNGLNLAREGSATAYPHDFVIEDCEFLDNYGHGMYLRGSQNITVRRCKFYRNGQYAPTGGHGFSSGACNTSVSSGWANTSGTIYSRTLGTAELDVYYVQSPVAGYPRVRRTASAATTPGVGEYGVSGTTLYINVGVTPNGITINYAWGQCRGLVIEQCQSYNNYWNVSAPFHEGHGFAFDDYTEDSIFTGNLSYNNEGLGFSINRGDRNIIRSNIAYGNHQAAVSMNPNDDAQIINNTFVGNNAGTGAQAGEIVAQTYSKNAIITNNIIVSTVAYGISTETTDTGFSGTKNNITGHTTAAEKNPFVTATETVAPALDSLYRPAATQLKRAGVYLGGKDYNGKAFYNPPNIGAVDDKTTTPRYTLIEA